MKRTIVIVAMLLCMTSAATAAPWLFTNPKFQALDSNGDPLTGGKLYTYECGTSTNRATYPTAADALAGTNANANPVVLDSRGEADIYGRGCTKFVLKTSADVQIWSEDNIQLDVMAGLNNVKYLSEYADAASPAQSALDVARADIGATVSELVIDVDDSMSESITFPATLTLRFIKGSELTTTGYTLTINGPIEAGLWQLFAGTGTVTLSSASAQVEEVYPQWWGADGSDANADDVAIQAAVDSGAPRVFFPQVSSKYIVDNPITLQTSNFEFIGHVDLPRIAASSSFPTDFRGVIEIPPSALRVHIRNLDIRGDPASSTRADYGILTPIAGDSTDDRKHLMFENLLVTNYNTAGLAISAWMTSFDNVRTSASDVGVGFLLGKITVNSVQSGREGTSMNLTNCYALAAGSYGFHFIDVQGFTMQDSAADTSDTDEVYAFRVEGSKGSVIGFDAETIARAFQVTDAGSQLVVAASRFTGLADPGIGTIQEQLIDISDGHVTINNTSFSADGVQATDYTNFLNVAANADHLVLINNVSDLLAQTNSINSAAQVTELAGPGTVAVRASATAQSLSNNSEATVDFDNDSTLEGFDYGSDFNTTTNTFTAPGYGLYWYDATVKIANSADATYLEINVVHSAAGDIATERCHASVDSNLSCRASGHVHLDKDETLHITALQNSGGAVNTVAGQAGSLLFIRKVQ